MNAPPELDPVEDRERLQLVVSYDGSNFAGSQLQRGVRTVQGELGAALTALAGSPVRTVFAGRTDRGVHAAGQVVTCADIRPGEADERILRAVNGLLPEDISVTSVRRRPASFHARFDSLWREYRYRIWSGPRQPLVRGHVWERIARLDAMKMHQAAQEFVGERDMAALASHGRGVPWSERDSSRRGTVRTVLRCECEAVKPWWCAGGDEGTLIEIQVAADGFLPRMVRAMVSLLVEVGRGARRPGWIGEVLSSRDRRQAVGSAPAHGLVLWRVGYADD